MNAALADSAAEAPVTAPSPTGGAEVLQRLRDFGALVRLRLNSLTIFAVIAGWWAVAPPDGRLFPAALGAALVAGGSSAINQVIERRRDALMTRTADRPVATGRMSPREAFTFGALLSVAGLGVLAVATNLLTFGLAVLCFVLYVCVYTPLKSRTAFNTLVGTIPGALPPVMGVAAATGTLGPAAVFLFALLVLWQLPHFLAIAWIWRDDYRKAGFAMLPVTTGGDATTGRQVIVQCLVLMAVSFAASTMGLAGTLYTVVALVSGAAFTAVAVYFAVKTTDAAARLLMRASIIYLPIVLVAFAMDRLPA